MRTIHLVLPIISLISSSGCIKAKKAAAALSDVPKSEMTDVERASAKDLFGLIKTNTGASREELAKALESQGQELLAATDEKSKALREITFYAVRALRVGGDKLCADADKITVFRGIDKRYVSQTIDGKPVLMARSFQKDLANLAHTLREYAQAIPAEGGNPGEEAINPFDFMALSGRHTVGISLGLSPFISTANSAGVASAFGDTMMTMKMCPGRIPSTGSQAWAEQEMLAHLFILPEEIVSVTPNDGNNPGEGLLARCYAPEIGVGSRADPKSVDQDNFDFWNGGILDLLARERSSGQKADWARFSAGFMERCSCSSLVRSKSIKWLLNSSNEGRHAPYEQALECDGVEGFKHQPVVYVTEAETFLKSRPLPPSDPNMKPTDLCKVKRGMSFAVEGISAENGHVKFTTREKLPAGCETLGSDLYLISSHVQNDLP